MLLAVDIGNTNIKFGVFDGDSLVRKLAIPTLAGLTPGAIANALDDRIPMPVTGAVVCSVVPELNEAVTGYIKDTSGVDALVIENDHDLGLTIDYEPLSDAGADRLVNSFAAAEKYGTPCIVCSFGTALTIDAVDNERRLLGGIISPGMSLMAAALSQNTARLPLVEIARTERVIQNTTAGSISSGVYNGYISMFEGLVKRFIDEMGCVPRVIATGGSASLIASETSVIDTIDPDLLLDGLRILYSKQHP